MASATARLSELPLRSSVPLTSQYHSSSFFCSAPRPSFGVFLRPLCSLRTTTDEPQNSQSLGPRPSQKAAPWLAKWPPIDSRADEVSGIGRAELAVSPKSKDKAQNAIERIVLRLRNLGLGPGEEQEGENFDGEEMPPTVTGEEKLGDLLRREWVRPDAMLKESDDEDGAAMLPWEREEENEEAGEVKKKRKTAKAPTLAELTLEDEELRRLRRMGMYLRERINVPKAGLTQAVLDGIYDKWRKQELVRLKFHESLSHDMKTAHEITERRTGGLVIWRSGSVMVVYRGSNYEGPSSRSQPDANEGDGLFVPQVSSAVSPMLRSGSDGYVTSTSERSTQAVRSPYCPENMTEEEREFNSLLEGLGPRFVEWWGTGVLPVDADLLPPKIPGYKTPFRLLPTGMRSRLTNAEMTGLRRLARSLPCHFALGRNRNHQGLAQAILQLWEKSLVVKIAVKRGIQNTNNKLMADELKTLTGGLLLSRNKYYIVMYRGKDFVPPSVAAALAERQELANKIQDDEEKVRFRALGDSESGPGGGQALAGTLAEFKEAQERWGKDISSEAHEKMVEQASKAKNARLIKQIEHKLAVAQAKKLRAERLLAKIEKTMVPAGPDCDQETITDEERVMFRRVGLRMKAYLPLGIRGVFDGVIENMHLHWKHRELVKLITKQKTLSFVEDTARLLEYESGGILVAIERVPKGYAVIYYRGKNYKRPISIRPRNLLTKAKALKRAVAMQRHEALSQRIVELEQTIEQMKRQIGLSEDIEDEGSWSSEGDNQFDHASEFSQSEDEISCIGSDDEFDQDEEGYVEEDYSEENFAFR